MSERGPAMLELLEKKSERQSQRHGEPTSGNDTNISGITWGLKALVVLLVALPAFVGAMSKTPGMKETTRRLSPIVHSPVTVIDEVEHLPAPSWKAIPVSLPHEGIVSIHVRVLRGNTIDAFLTPPDQLERIERGEWGDVKSYVDITSVKTDAFRQTGWLAKGEYYLVVKDLMIGLPSSLPSDVSVKVQVHW